MNLKKQLALAVRNIQWSYGIFWSISASQPGILEWGEGYYNGDIKTRKTVQSVEFKADQLGLQRSEQLRELYESLLADDSSAQARVRPSAALSPEDLTDTEWYYLVCMSFVFNIGQGHVEKFTGSQWIALRRLLPMKLPGRALSSGQPIWLCNAQYADSKVFICSLVAKSASIQTVVCCPFAEGVVELGVTDLVSKDLNLIRRVKSSFLDSLQTIVSNKSIPIIGSTQNNEDLACPALRPQTLDTESNPLLGCELLEIASPNDTSDGFEPNQPAENSSDCISQTFVDHGDECNHTKRTSLDLRSDDLHYRTVLSALLKSSHQLNFGPHFRNSNKESSFVSWKMNGLAKSRKAKDETPQKLLKKILFKVPRMHDKGLLQSPEADEICGNHVLSERRRREKINERFTILRSLVPSNSKADKVSILDDTIEHLKDLERRVDELQSWREFTELETRTKRRNRDYVERTSDNYCNKRKACDAIDEAKQDIEYVESKDGSTDNLTVSMNNKDLLIEFRCQWRAGILIEIMDALTFLDLDCHSVQSSTVEGILSMTIKSKYKGSTVVKPGTVKQALQRVQSSTFV